MYIIGWHKELETGIELIDEQHKQFFIHVNKFIIKARAGKKHIAAVEEIDFLVNYLLYHFQAEETFQMESQYPDYLSHKAEHKTLGFRVKEIIVKLNANDFSSESIELFYTMLIDWVEQHILKMDLDFAVYYKNNKLYHLQNQ